MVLFEVYKKDFERWVRPLADWLKERKAWSWVIPTAILVILSFPPLFGHEIVQLIVGVSTSPNPDADADLEADADADSDPDLAVERNRD